MTRAIGARWLVAGAAALVLTSCGGNGGASPTLPGSASRPAAISAPFNEADVTFTQLMIPQFQQAVTMADLALVHATDPQLRQLAAQIKAAQQPQMQTFLGWLTTWGKEPMGHEVDHTTVPGRITSDDFVKLMAAKGVAFDRLFAQLMTMHHNGALKIARDELAHGTNAAAKAAAATIERTHTTDVATLREILNRR